ncbi:MAG: PAS domain-containing protein [Desulfobacteraceae bacterium]|nr:PAS domain-containing protein [Desulfobacteraceae bacterium]
MTREPPDKTSHAPLPKAERNRRKREMIIIAVVIAVVALLTFVENRIIHFGADFPVSNTILMFTLININLLLLLLLIFLVFRNLVKLLYDRRRKVMGAKLRTRLIVAFIALSLLPTTILFFFSINFITASIEFWFNVPVEQALENSLRVGRTVYDYSEENHRFLLERISYQVVKKDLLSSEKKKALSQYIQIVQREFNLHAVEVYASNTNRLTYALSVELETVGKKSLPAGELQKQMSPSGIRTISTVEPDGEFIQTIGTIPFNTPTVKGEGFIVLTRLIPIDLSENMSSISRGFEEYQQIKMLKKPIQITYYITLSIVALLVVFCAVWFGFYLAKTITIPIMELADGTRRVADGELEFTIDMVSDDEIGSLVTSFNKMTHDLQVSRDQLEYSAQILRIQNTEIEEQRRYMVTVLKNVSAGVVTLDADGLVTTLNTSAERMLNVSADEILHRSYKNLVEGGQLKIAEDIIENLSSSRSDTAEIPLRATISGRPRSFLFYINVLKDENGQQLGIVMVIDDLTEMEKAQRMAAWREVARRIAHEVKNPLTPITLSAQRLKRKFSEDIDDPIFEECIRLIIDHVELIRNLVNEFSTFARFPTANPGPCELVPIIDETLDLYREGYPQISFDIQVDDNIPVLNLDRQQLKQAMINLVDNAVSAIRGRGSISISLSHDSILKLVRIEIADDGSGISDEDKIRLFEPNFSTKKTGMGLGLTIVNSIITDHNGFIRVQDNPPQGAKFVIEIPTP